MSQIFHPAANAIAKGSIFGAVFILAAAAWVMAVLDTSPYYTNVGVSRAQPVPFSHEHHVNGLGVSCLYCHTSVKELCFCRHSANQDVHDLPLADLDKRRDSRTRAGQLA